MRPAHVIEIQTPKKYLLNGLWFGPTFAKASAGKPKKPKRAIIWIHGLSSSAFSKLSIVEKLVDKDTAVITFNNRGSGTVTKIRRLNAKRKEGIESIFSGGAHEVFTESVDDIQGAVNFARKAGVKEIYLAGHSTGTQKSVFYSTRKGNNRYIRGVILLAPISDYSAEVHFDKGGRLAKGLKAARSLIKQRKQHTIVPEWWMDAQRFISLHTPDSVEEIFSYVNPKKIPRTYRALQVPTLVLLAEKDEYADRPATKMAAWFGEHSRSKRFNLKIILKAGTSFKGAEMQVARAIKQWILA